MGALPIEKNKRAWKDQLDGWYSLDARSVGYSQTRGTGLGNVLDETKADVTVPKVGIVPEPVRDTQVRRSVQPGTATEHARIFPFVVPVHTPLPDVPGHVIAPIRADPVGILGNRRCTTNCCPRLQGEDVAQPGRVYDVAFVLIKLVPPGILAPVLAPRGLFPFPLSR